MTPWVLVYFLMQGSITRIATATDWIPMPSREVCFREAEKINAKTDVSLRAMCVNTSADKTLNKRTSSEQK